jgi:hypothetical protein
LGVQVVRINADLLHFHSTSFASDSSIGGVDRIGAKEAAQASARIATMSKGDFIAVLPFRGACRLAVFLNPVFYRSHVYNELWFQPVFAGRGKRFRRFVTTRPTKRLHKIATVNLGRWLAQLDSRSSEWKPLSAPVQG